MILGVGALAELCSVEDDSNDGPGTSMLFELEGNPNLMAA